MESIVLSADEHLKCQYNFAQVADLMNATWQSPRWEYTQELLSAYVNRPTQAPSLSLAYYHQHDFAGYICYIPYNVRLDGLALRTVMGTWWTARKEYVYHQVGFKLASAAQRWAREQGFYGYLSVTHHGTGADRANRAMLDRLQAPCVKLRTFGQFVCLPRTIRSRLASVPQRGTTQRVGERQVNDVAGLALQPRPGRGLFMELCSEEIRHVFLNRPNTASWVYYDKQGHARGLCNIIRKGYRGDTLLSNAYVEHMEVSQLSNEQFRDFMRGILFDTIWDTVDALSIPDSAHYPSDLLRASGFFPSIRKFNLYFVSYDASIQARPVEAFHIDLF